jgi:hypothetical protein
MGRKVLHKSLVIHRTHVTITTTQCRRSVNGSDGMNIADTDAEVTCKFCLRLMNPRLHIRADAFASDATGKPD